MPFTETAREKRRQRNSLISELYRAGWTADRIATRGDVGGITPGAVLKILQRAGVARRSPGPQPGGGSATPAPATGTRCPRCRRVGRDLLQEQCECGWMFWITQRRDPGPRLFTRTKFYEVGPRGEMIQTSGPRDDY